MALSPTELESLLTSERWIRGLARRLATDPGTADDLTQETLVAALTARQGRPGERSWLARVLRNAWKDHQRGRARRERRERATAAAEALAPTDELVAELELRERLTRALRELEEPYRGTLARRYFRDESLVAIARADGVALSTVHERIERGLEQLRARLDVEHGGRRSAWAATMLALGRRAGGGLDPLEVVTTMAAGSKAALAGVLVAGVLGWWWLARERAPEPQSRTSVAPPLASEPAAPASVATPPSPPEVSMRERVEPVGESPPPVPVVEPARLVGRVVDASGAPVASVAIALERSAGPLTATSASDGRFTLPVDPAQEWGALRCTDERLLTLVAGAPRGPERVVIVAPRRTVAGQVVDPDGLPLAGAALAFRPLPSLFRELGLELAKADAQAGWSAQSGGDGRFELGPIALGPHLGLEARALGHQTRQVDLSTAGDGELTVVLSPDPRTRLLSGFVLGPEGLPFAGARVSAGHEIVTSAQDGRFELAAHADTGRNVQDEQGVWRPETRARVRVFAVAPGRAPDSVEVELASPPSELVLRLGSEPLSISGWVLDLDGAPRSGVVLWPRALTPFGRVPRGLEGIGDDRTVEGELCDTDLLGIVTDADGQFSLGCLLDQVYDLEVFDSRTSGRSVVEGVRPGRSDLEIRFAPEPGTVRIAGRVVSPRGEPMPGVEIRPRRATFDRTSIPLFVGAEYSRETDAEGRFEFEALATAGTVLDVFTLPWRAVELSGFPDPEQVEIVVPALRELQVVLRDPGFADAFAVLDPAGAELEVIEMLQRDGRSLSFSMDERTQLVAGRSSVVRAPETACTLVLFRQGLEVLRRSLVLDPAAPTVIQL